MLTLDLYYNWREDELSLAQHELALSEEYKQSGQLTETTPYIDAVINSDLVIDFSGDIWGDKAHFLGKDRFKVGLYKNKIAQNRTKELEQFYAQQTRENSKKFISK